VAAVTKVMAAVTNNTATLAALAALPLKQLPSTLKKASKKDYFLAGYKMYVEKGHSNSHVLIDLTMFIIYFSFLGMNPNKFVSSSSASSFTFDLNLSNL
jgi:hypothetical protein